MEKQAKIYVAGHTGLVGSSLVRRLRQEGYNNLLLRTHDELDLTDSEATQNFFHKEKPDYVFMAAAKVGGVYINSVEPADFGRINLQIAVNTIDAAYRSGVKKLLYMGSSCIYPKLSAQPIKEEYLLTGALEKTNESYALAKIMGVKLCEAYNIQYGTNFISCMPCNAYGPGDHFDPEASHVVPALIRKFHEAKIQKKAEVVMWGSGKPIREFIYIDDIASAACFLMNNYSGNETVNVGTGMEYSILELAQMIQQIVGYEGKIVHDLTKPDGTPRKLVDASKIFAMGWRPKMEFEDGIRATYENFLLHEEEYMREGMKK